jgi:hypothetical protein
MQDQIYEDGSEVGRADNPRGQDPIKEREQELGQAFPRYDAPGLGLELGSADGTWPNGYDGKTINLAECLLGLALCTSSAKM